MPPQSAQAAKLPSDRKALALVGLREPVVLESQRVVNALRTLFPELRAAAIDVADTPDQASALTMMIGEELVAIMFFAFPIPPETLEPALGNELMWKEARVSFGHSPAHLLITTLSNEHSLEQRIRSSWLLTMVVAALGSVYAFAGILWSPSLIVLEPEHFEKTAVACRWGQWPTDLWFGLEWFKGETFDKDHAIVCRTRGIGFFASRELEFGPAIMEPGKMGQWLMALARYIILSGKFFGDKDTMELGEGTDNTAQISYEQSPYGGGAPVLKVVMR